LLELAPASRVKFSRRLVAEAKDEGVELEEAAMAGQLADRRAASPRPDPFRFRSENPRESNALATIAAPRRSLERLRFAAISRGGSDRRLAMQKVEGSSPFIRSSRKPVGTGFSPADESCGRSRHVPLREVAL
jgi:hypothetical protein